MPIPLSMDVHIPEAVTTALRRRNVDILTSQDDKTRTRADDVLLSRASELGRVLVTQDSDLLGIAQERQQDHVSFSGVIYSRQQFVTIGGLVEDLYLIATCCECEELSNQVVYLPLK